MLALLLLGVASLIVEGQTTCPSPAQLEARLAEIAPAAARADVTVRLSRAGASLQLELIEHGASTFRRLPATAACDELATAAAIAIAVRLGVLPGPDVPSPALSAPPPVAPAQPEPTRRARPPVTYDVAAAFIAAFADTQFAPGGEVALMLTRAPQRFAGRLAFWATGTRDLTLGAGRARFDRFAWPLGANARLRAGRFRFDLHADFVLGLLWARGIGLEGAQSRFAFDPGLAAGFRASVKTGPVLPFVEVSLTGWLLDEQVSVTNPDLSRHLPRVDTFVAFGLAFGNYL